MNSQYLTEAFKELNLLEEDVFPLDGVKDEDDVTSFRELVASDDDIINVIDADATKEEELEDSYVGKVVLDCCVCHSKIYKDADSIIIDDDAELANVGEECPYCYSVGGYKVIGKIAPYEEEAELKVKVEDKASDEDNADVSDEAKVTADEEDIDESCTPQKKDKKNESFEKVELETEDKVIKVSEEEKEAVPDAEMIEPLDIDTKKEIVDATADESGVVDDLTNEDDMSMDSAEDAEDDNTSDDEYVEQDFDEFDEEDFDDLGESYLKRVYENVNSFKTSNVKIKGNTLTVEGVIKFNSGASKNTTFLFEAKDITRKGKVRFIGENLQISKGKKSFTLVGSVSGKTLVSESLNYNYRAKDAAGKSVRLYGTIKR